MRYFIIFLLAVFSCRDTDKASIKKTITKEESNRAYLTGQWECCSQMHGFILMEFTDSLYQAGDFEHGYICFPDLPIFEGDSIYLHSDTSAPRWRETFVKIKKQDSSNMIMMHKYDTIRCRKSQFSYSLADFDWKQKERFLQAYWEQKNAFNCK